MNNNDYVFPDKWILEIPPNLDPIVNEWCNKKTNNSFIPTGDARPENIIVYNESGEYYYKLYDGTVKSNFLNRPTISFDEFRRYVLNNVEDYSYLINVFSRYKLV